MLHTLSIGILLVTLFMMGWIAFTFFRAWMIETGSFWQRTLEAGQKSATIVWAKLVIMAAGIVAGLDKIADLVGDTTLTAQIQQYVTPQMVGYVMIAIMLVNVWARLRTLGK